MKKILVLGSTGMLGHMVLKVLAQEKAWKVKGMNASDFDAANDVPDTHDYDYVINCIGVLAGGEEEKMKKVNAEFPHWLAKATSARIIHMSTDGVFSGKSGPYDEDSPCDAEDAYGKSKIKGEVEAPNVINIRTSIIGPSPNKKKGLLEWFLSQPEGATVQGFTNHIWNGVTTLQFAQLCEKIIREDRFEDLRAEASVFHFTPNEPITKYDLLCLFKKVFEKNVNVERMEDHRGSVERVLTTKYEGLKKLFPYGRTMEEAVEELKKFSHPS
ncbi:SDR family oxidoreductase [Candidatus Uhrbacteria bacterium]|nr:SDR family oxidoreductase [Candidatus Uhrbacteria bacterium]